MPDLRDVLRQGADVTTGLPDMPTVWTRAVRQRRRRRMVASAGAATVVAVVALIGAVLDPSPPPPPQPVTTPRLPHAQQLPPYPGPLQPGQTYDTRVLQLPFGFSVPDSGWTMAAREPGWLSLHRADARLNLQRWDSVFDPAQERPEVTDGQSVPADLPDWLSSHPRLRVESRATVPLAGHDWQVLEVTVRAPLARQPTECGSSPCVLLGQVGTESVELLASERARLYVRSDEVGPTIVLVAFPAAAPGPGTAVTHLLDSLHERPLS